MDNLQKVEQIVRDVFDDSSISVTKGTIIRELPNWDSFTHISLMAAIQDEFHTDFSIEEISSIERIQEILEKIESYGKN
ncbi:acyl carrier protein [Succinivibrio dextrinosolvens]|uniref:acyl carrier protein n=1 Tax=Succinivibrio dextrinosolvens TaxID=83771 RepID=UPI0024793376|nr:acyl carrier protein [Succinivibrio dextrinosolvens]